ncbi:APC family permease [Hornefia butyriciproducens]|uniref:Amino acid permease n=1 Tax=Hornefia butyriciproducens TaxID=2652293 RepID=A0A6L5Y3J1_9FIRM|nr:amino acid permease [Hornefia butyriciproducens]MCI7413254.1 amino acid permease [Clostridiales bacterium]MDD7019421.1 amino acid permease [Hornefia butyriciproducens]MDY5423572.1 amino acid permease [Hornefia butyriciproducens]MDY5462660.1 amino acid permease [Hornefia butyriciproducens]MDY6211448.1 amino acid permease [Hornefia butyriciproducens]
MNDEKKLAELTTEQTEFKREIGVFGGVSIIGGIMIGSGIFYLGSYVLQRTGMNSGLALICWIVAGVISLFAGLCYAELGCAMPKAGGRLVYLNEAYHPVFGFMAGFTDWLVGGPGSIAAVSIAMMTVLKPFVGLSDTGVKIAAVILIVGATLYNLIGVKVASVIQDISLVAKLVPILIILVAALVAGKASPDLSLGSASTYAAENHTSIIGMMAIAIVAALWAYEGWSNLNTVTEEIKNPKRNLPLAIIIGIGGVTVLYTLFNFAIMKVLPHETIVNMINNEDLYLGTAVAKQVLGSAGAVVVSVGMILAMFGSMNGMILAQPRMYYAMAEEGHFFKSFAKLHPKYRIPTVPIIVQGVLSCVLVLLRNLDQLTNLVVLSVMLFNVLVIIAVPILRRKYPNIERPYKVWFYPVSVVVVAAIFVGLFIQGAMEDPVNGFAGFAVPAVGAVVYYIFDRKIKKEAKGNE